MNDMEQAKRIASSDAGKRLSQMANTPEIEAAAKSGDVEALKNAVSKLLSTDAGAALARQISEMMK
jgi:hypothetical protein